MAAVFCLASMLHGNAAVSPTAIRPNSDGAEKTPSYSKNGDAPAVEKTPDSASQPVLSEKRKALFEPLAPISVNGRRPSAESLLPPPDFDSAVYPRGWLIGKKRKLVNVDVVESMRRIAVQEMNRKVMLLLLSLLV